MIRHIGRLLGVGVVVLTLVAVATSPARTAPPTPTPQATPSGSSAAGTGARAQELPARNLPPVWANAFWNAKRVQAATPRSVARDAETNTYSVGGNVAIGVRSNRRLLVEEGNNTLSALWPGNDAVRRATGKVMFSMAGQYFTCSGTVVTDTSTQRSVVLTAAHCVYDPSYGFAQNWVFVPDYVDGPAPLNFSGSFCGHTALGCWTAQSMIVSRGFAYQWAFDETASLHDYAFVSVNLGGRDGKSQLDRVVRPLPIRTGATIGTNTWALGYPVAYPYNGAKLIYSRTPLGRDAENNNRTYRIGSVMTQGSSGGPWIQGLPGNPVIVSLTSYGYDNDPHLQGPMLTSETMRMLSAVTSQSGNRIY